MVTALAYVDLNPVRAGMVGSAQEYSWSSARAHVEEEDALGLIDFSLWRQVRGRDDWAASLSRPPDADATRRLREATQRGVPLGSEDFVETLEQSTGRSWRYEGRDARRGGRPAKRTQDEPAYAKKGSVPLSSLSSSWDHRLWKSLELIVDSVGVWVL